MVNANSVRHRILAAQDWLEKIPEPAAPQKTKEKLYKRNPDGSLVLGYQVSVCSLVGHYGGLLRGFCLIALQFARSVWVWLAN